ncbi:hypothetical protein GCM10011504_06410 [Siccirubricoccus deserti]|nr:hypothetical protein GCM10011504_06410 [Siccirubricoccus deserti]
MASRYGRAPPAATAGRRLIRSWRRGACFNTAARLSDKSPAGQGGGLPNRRRLKPQRHRPLPPKPPRAYAAWHD